MRKLQFQNNWRIASHSTQHFPLVEGTVSQIRFESSKSKLDLAEFGSTMYIPPWYSVNGVSYPILKEDWSEIRTIDVFDEYYGTNRAILPTSIRSVTVLSGNLQQGLDILDYAKTHNVMVCFCLHNIWTQEEYHRNDPLYYPCTHNGHPCGATDFRGKIDKEHGWIKDTELEQIAQKIVENNLQVVTSVNPL